MKAQSVIKMVIISMIILQSSCNQKGKKETQTKAKDTMNITIYEEEFGQVNDTTVHLYTLKNKSGMTVKLTNYGGIITSIQVPDKNGKIEDIALGFDSLAPYVQGHPYFGAIVGRYGNRINKGKYSYDGKDYQLTINDGIHHLHGGTKGFDKVIWKADTFRIAEKDEAGVRLTYLSKDKEQGYPGNFKIELSYSLNNENELLIEYQGETDHPTPVNVTHHSYFNLTGCKENILNHELMIAGDRFTVVDETLIPTGELRPVEETPMDFRSPNKIGARIDEAGGYDHNFVLDKEPGTFKLAASLYEPKSGRFMQVFTTEPGVQFYSGNFLDGSIIGKNKTQYNKHYGLCLETQHFPDSPNQKEFPNTILKPNEKYYHKTIYKFSVQQ